MIDTASVPRKLPREIKPRLTPPSYRLALTYAATHCIATNLTICDLLFSYYPSLVTSSRCVVSQPSRFGCVPVICHWRHQAQVSKLSRLQMGTSQAIALQRPSVSGSTWEFRMHSRRWEICDLQHRKNTEARGRIMRLIS